MIAIDNKLISDEVLEKHFVCDLNACKGGCCVLGEGGAPLEVDEAAIISGVYDQVKPYLKPEGIAAIEDQGFYTKTTEKDGYATLRTTLVDGGPCAYIHEKEDGLALCGIEMAYRDGKIPFMKPVSCHLYPIRAKETAADKDVVMVNYNDWDICDPACSLGEKMKVPLYRFLKEPIIRKWGQGFYDTLEASAAYLEIEDKE